MRIALIVIFFASWSLLGMKAGVVTNVPVKRLEENLSRHLEKTPQDARALYALGRIHALAFAQMRDTVRVNPGLNLSPPDLSRPGDPIVGMPPQFTPSAASKQHLEKAILNYRKAIELEPENALYHLGLGWMLHQGALNARFYGAPPGYPPCEQEGVRNELRRAKGDLGRRGDSNTEPFQLLLDHLPCALDLLLEDVSYPPLMRHLIDRLAARAWEDEAILAYRRAHELSFDLDYAQGGYDVVSMEAAKNIIAVLSWYRTATEATPQAAEEIEYLEERIEQYYKVSRAISPIIFPTDAEQELAALISDQVTVTFDLDGDGFSEHWPWLRPNAAFLVWDPTGEGRIDSGLQLFGNVTWWMFWENGYEPLRFLDNNDDGWLKGEELEGIGVWRDFNQNGVSEEGEVIASVCAGIVGISVVPTGEEDGIPCNRTGLQMIDGRMLPTYDWTPTSIVDPRGEAD